MRGRRRTQKDGRGLEDALEGSEGSKALSRRKRELEGALQKKRGLEGALERR